MSVTATSNSTASALATQAVSAASQSSASSSSSSGISMSDFMKILSAELQYQDPLSGDSSGGSSSSNSDYITQMVEYNLLSQVEAMTSQMKFASAPAAIGQNVIYAAKDSSGNVVYDKGAVSAVDLTGDTPSYLVDGVWVDQSSISGFYNASATGTGSATGTDSTAGTGTDSGSGGTAATQSA